MRSLPSLLGLGLVASGLFACSQSPAPPTAASAGVETTAAASPALAGDPVEGLRVATRVGCNGCHGAQGEGAVFQDNPDFGRIVAPNLTQRRDIYDDKALEALLRRGRTHDGHVPWGMPVRMFEHLSDREIRDISAWLRALPPAANPTLPAGQWSEALARSTADGTHPWLEDMRPTPGHQPPAAPPTDAQGLGRHLALTTCSECHGWDLNGFGDDPTPSLVVAKAYTPEQFMRLMRTGEVAAGGRSATGLMSAVAVSRFSAMTDDEIHALKAYLDAR